MLSYESCREMDGEYGTAQAILLYQLPRFSDAGPLDPEDDRSDALRRICLRIVEWGVSYNDLQKRALDHSVWMYACQEYPEEVVYWDEKFSNLDSDEERTASAEQFRTQYEDEYLEYIAQNPDLLE